MKPSGSMGFRCPQKPQTPACEVQGCLLFPRGTKSHRPPGFYCIRYTIANQIVSLLSSKTAQQRLQFKFSMSELSFKLFADC